MATMMREFVSELHPGDQGAPILSARCVVPRLPELHVDRPRLHAGLDRGAALPLTVVSAPAGIGKTTATAAWVAQRQARDPSAGRIGWITFENGDDRPRIFWPLVVACLRRCGVPVPSALLDGTSRSRRRMLSALGSALAGLSHPLTLVLDGYEIADRDLAAGLDFLLGHSGGQLRLVILTRADPTLPLHRFRLSGDVAELRMADLAMTEDETAELLRTAGIALRQEATRSLFERTRGWAAGLRLAAMMLEGSPDPGAALAGMTGDTGTIADYLRAEILQGQAADVRDVLLRTSVVGMLRPGLIEMLGGPSAGRTLASLTHENVLVEEVSGMPGCYRYHPLLRELLCAELTQRSPARLASQRRRARAWCAERGLVADVATRQRDGTAPVTVQPPAEPETAPVRPLRVLRSQTSSKVMAGSAPGEVATYGPLVEQLTDRELEVLHQLEAFLNTEEIAATLFVSVNTVRTHVRNIFRKLAVNRRSDAVRRARALDLLGA